MKSIPIQVGSMPSSWQLLDGAGGQTPTDDEFFATGQGTSLIDAPTFQVPAHAWRRLSAADRPYYRIWTSRSAAGWVDAETTTPHGAASQAPHVQIDSLSTGEALSPSQAPLNAIWERARQQAALQSLLGASPLRGHHPMGRRARARAVTSVTCWGHSRQGPWSAGLSLYCHPAGHLQSLGTLDLWVPASSE